MEVSALKYSGGVGLHGRSPLLRLKSDENLVALVRRGNTAAFEVLVSRYEARLLAFCRHMLGSREDAEDVLQDVLASAYNAILGDERPINVRPWLYRIARNRSLNHMRRAQAIAVDTMDLHFSDHGATTADKVGDREEFRMLVSDIQSLPETQRTALVLREMDALSYEQIAEAMETTVPSVKSLLVRARVSLAEAAEARMLTCDEVRLELGELAEGLRDKVSSPVRRHLKSCSRCRTFQTQLKHTNKALAAMLPVGPLLLLKKLVFLHLGHSAGTSAAGTIGSGATASGGAVATGAATATSTAAAGAATAGAVASGTGGIVTAGVGALATKAAVGLAAAALVTAGAVEVGHHAHAPLSPTQIAERQAAAAAPVKAGLAAAASQATFAAPVTPRPVAAAPVATVPAVASQAPGRKHRHHAPRALTLAALTASKTATALAATVPSAPTTATSTAPAPTATLPTTPAVTSTPATTPATTATSTPTSTVPTTSTPVATTPPAPVTTTPVTPDPGRTAVTVAPTVLPPSEAGTAPAVGTPTPGLTPTTTTSTITTPTTTTPTGTTTTPTGTTPTTTTPTGTTTTPTTTTPTTSTPTGTASTPTTTTPTTGTTTTQGTPVSSSSS